ncbi:MAG: transketolase [Ruminococcaceae bacterium]|nr:transketolase [Oscillospiraceae bacterium]
MDVVAKKELAKVACNVRKGIIEGTFNAKSGHPGGSLSIADIISYLYFKEMNIDPSNPAMPERDRFVLSKGHAAPALYAVMAERGYFPVEELKTLRKIGSRLQGHPSMKCLPGIDISTGSLGQGISAACGMALGAKLQNADFRVYSILGDGEIEEGQVWEAAMYAAAKKLDNLVAFVDNNNLQIDGTVEEVNSPYPIPEKFVAFGWNVIEIDGHSFDEIENALNAARECKGKPTAIVAKTIKGKGVSFMENQVNWHGAAPNAEQYEIAMNELNEVLNGLEAL